MIQVNIHLIQYNHLRLHFDIILSICLLLKASSSFIHIRHSALSGGGGT